jgi:hypothetical protein
MDYSSWDTQPVSVTLLNLDPKNPRLPELGHEASQPEIIAELIRHEGVIELAKDISRFGYFPTEILVCIEDEGSLVVVEGNRRLASLKLLLNPESAPDEHVARFKKLAKDSATLPKQIRVAVAPSRSAAAPFIMNRHTKTDIKRWEPIQQARYIQSLLDSGATLDQLPDFTGFRRGDLVERLRTKTMYDIANTLPLSAPMRDIVGDPRRFNASTLERVIETPRLREFLGIEFDDEGGIIGKVHPDDFKRAYQRIVEDIVNSKVDTRVINNKAGITRYLKRIADAAPKRDGAFTSEGLLGKQGTGAQKRALRRKKAKAKPTRLIPKTFKCYLDLPRIHCVLEELHRLDVAEFENAVGILLRIFIELTISHYLDSTEKMNPLINRLDKHGKKSNTWSPSLRQMLNEILSNDPVAGLIPRQARKALNKAVSDDDHPLSLDGMDQFAHNPYDAPNTKQLFQMWSQFEDLIGLMMVEPTPPGTKP